MAYSGLILTLDGGRRKKKGRHYGGPESKDFVRRPWHAPQAFETN
jgi:hypothetical protein